MAWSRLNTKKEKGIDVLHGLKATSGCAAYQKRWPSMKDESTVALAGAQSNEISQYHFGGA
jgi:hypothetical protein